MLCLVSLRLGSLLFALLRFFLVLSCFIRILWWLLLNFGLLYFSIPFSRLIILRCWSSRLLLTSGRGVHISFVFGWLLLLIFFRIFIVRALLRLGCWRLRFLLILIQLPCLTIPTIFCCPIRFWMTIIIPCRTIIWKCIHLAYASLLNTPVIIAIYF